MAVTISQLYPVAGSTPPIPNMISTMVIATVAATSATDTSASITHGWGIVASISSGFPRITIENEASQTVGQPYELSENSEFTILGLQGIGSWKVFLERAHDIER